MKAPTFDAPSYGPDVLKAIAQAFDEAWQNIAGNFGGEAGAGSDRHTRAAILKDGGRTSPRA